jgi:hypothetical protein
MIVEDFNAPLSSIARSFRQQINKETSELNDTKLASQTATEYVIQQQHNTQFSQNKSYCRTQSKS